MEKNKFTFQCSSGLISSIVICSYLGLIGQYFWEVPLLGKVLATVGMIALGVLVGWSYRFCFTVTQESITVSFFKRMVKVIPWERLQWSVSFPGPKCSSYTIFMQDEEGKRYTMSATKWMVQLFLLCCPNPPTGEEIPELEDQGLTEQYILSDQKKKVRFALSSVFAWIGVLCFLLFLTLLPAIAIFDCFDQFPAAVLWLILALPFVGLVLLLTSNWEENSYFHALAAERYVNS